MKKLITKIITLLSISTPALHAKVTDELIKIQKMLANTKTQIHQAATDVKATHTKVQQQLIVKVENALENSIRPQAIKIQNNINDVSGAGIETALFVLGDANPITELRWMRDNPIKTITQTLESLQKTFSNLNSDIDPATDPKGIYADFTASEESFDKAIKNLQDIINALSMLNL